MTRKLSRNYSLIVVVASVAILALLIAAAVRAQTSGAGQTTGKANAVLAPAGTSASAQAERPLTPWTDGGGRFPVGLSEKRRPGASPMDENSLFLPAVAYDSGGSDSDYREEQVAAVAVADVNGDGKPDIAVTNWSSNTVGVLLGNGDGTFQPVVTYNSGGQNPLGVAIADVNGDGKPDIVVTNWSSNTVGVLLGNGDGTFQPAVTYGSGGSYAEYIAVADLNGDGKPDLVVGSWTSGVSVLLGNGDGTFQPAVTYAVYVCANSVVVADVNSDGKLDVLAGDPCGDTVDVLLGNGDGTLQPVSAYSSGGIGPYAIAVADVNGDSKPDLVAMNFCASGDSCPGGVSSVAVLLGNGDGTFRPAAVYDSGGGNGFGVAVADVNLDGKPDLIVANYGTNTVGVLLGNGDGTFGTVVTYRVEYLPPSVVAADVNGDGRPDLVVGSTQDINNLNDEGVNVLLNSNPTTTALVSSLNPSAYGQSVTFTAAVTAASATPTGTVIFYDGSTALGSVTLVNGGASLSTSSLSAGSRSITAAYQGFSAFLPSTSAPLIQVVNGLTTTTTLVSSPSPSVYGQAVTFTAAVNSASGTPTGTVIFYDGSTAIGSATLANGSASLSVSSLLGGAHSITAAYQGAGTFDPSTSAPLNQIVNPATTATSLVSSANPARPRQSVTYTATVTSQYGGATTGTVTFQDNGKTIATVALSGNQAAYSTEYKKGGSHAITATYSGDASNLGSTSATLTEYIETVASKTVLTTSGSPSYVGQPVTFTATVTPKHGAIPDGELVNFYDGKTAIGTGTTTSGVATFTTSSLKAETHTIKATYAGDDTFEPSSGLVKQVVDKYTTTTELSSSPNPSQLGQTVTFTATVTSAGPTPTGKVEFKDGTKEIKSVTLSGGVATLTTSKLAVGSHSITAEYTGDDGSAESTSPVLDQVVQ
jgi:hypothetical protein